MLTKTYIIKISTSGYSDRYIYTDLVVTDGHAKFRDPESYANFCEEKGIMSYMDAWDAAYHAPKTTQIYGKISPLQSMTITLSDDDYRSVDAYLKITRGKRASYTAEAWARWENQLTTHPLTGNLLKIVKWQLAQCDKKNLEMWGNVNGQE